MSIGERLRSLGWRIGLSRLGLAWHVLRGRPLAYRVRVEDGGFKVVAKHTKIVECTIVGGQYGVWIVSPPGWAHIHESPRPTEDR